MSKTILVNDCPRCRAANMTFDVLNTIPTIIQHNWQRWYEACSVCRNCHRATIFAIVQTEYRDKDFLDEHAPTAIDGSLNNHFRVEGFICLKDMGAQPTPEQVPNPIANAFHEGAVSVVTQCWNAAGTMFRLVIALTTKPMLPEEDIEGLNSKTRRDLGLRVPWLFDNGKLPGDLRELSKCVHQDGNDGAHAGTLTKEDALDLLDFTSALLERIFTEPTRIRLAQERREKRREKKQ